MGARDKVAKVMSINLVLAEMQVGLPAGVVALGISVEPAGDRQAEVDESAEGADRSLRSDHDRS